MKNDSNSAFILDLPREGFVRLNVVLAFFGIKKTAFYKGIKTGFFPKPVKIGPGGRISVWSVDGIRLVFKRINEGGVI